MYNKWIKRPRKPGHMGDLLICRLVESKRDGDGRPRQRLVRQLGTVREAIYTNHRIAFWQDVDFHLDDLGLDDATKGKLRTAIMTRVPFTTEEQRERRFGF